MISTSPFAAFKVMTFDVVGTLIDFEAGVLDAVRRISGRKAAELSDDQIFASYKRGRDAHPERSSEVMFHVYRYLAKELGLPALVVGEELRIGFRNPGVIGADGVVEGIVERVGIA